MMCPPWTASSACPALRTGSITTRRPALTSCSPAFSPPPCPAGTDEGNWTGPGARVELEIAALPLVLASVALTLCRVPGKGWVAKELVMAEVYRGRARGAGSELALACDMRFAARENAIFGQIEAGAGAVPGAGRSAAPGPAAGTGRAMEAILGADDFDAEVAE